VEYRAGAEQLAVCPVVGKLMGIPGGNALKVSHSNVLLLSHPTLRFTPSLLGGILAGFW